MRQEAKMGLAQMEAMGQMGNSEEAVMPDNLPFDMYDLDIEEEDEYNMARGGVVKMQQGGTTYTPPSIGGYTSPPPVTTGFSGPQPIQPFQSGQGQFKVAGAAEGAVTPKTSIQGVTPTFGDFVGMNVPGVDFKMVTFYDENGQAKVLKQFPDGSYEDPANPGVKVSPTDIGLTQEIKTETTPTQQRVETAKVVDDGGKDPDEGKSPQTKIGWGGESDPNKPGTKKNVTMVDFSVIEIPGMLPGVAGTLAGSAQALMGKDYPDNAKLGISVDGVTTPVSGADYNAAKKGANGLAYTGNVANEILDRAQTNAATVNAAIARYGITKSPYGNKTFDGFMGEAARSDAGIKELAEEYGFDYDSVKDNPFGFGKNYDDAVAKAVEAANKGRKSTYVDRFGTTQISDDPFTKDDIIDGHKARTRAKAMKDAIKEKARKGELTAGQIEQARIDAALAKSGEQKGSGMKSEAEATAQSEAYERDTGARVGGDGRSGTDATGSTGVGTGTDCLTEKMKVKLNGVIDFVTNIKVGDMIDGSVVKEVLHKHMRNGYFVINNELEITNDHPVWAKSGGLGKADWIRPEQLVVGDTINGVKVTSLNYIDRMTPTVSIVVDGDSFDVYTEGNTYTVHGRYREVRQQAA